MRISHVLSKGLAALLLVCACALTNATSAQTTDNQSSAPAPQPTPTVILPQEKSSVAVAGHTDLYCAGFIQYAPAHVNPQIVGGEQEQEQRAYAEGDYVFINAGSQQDIHVGQEFAIVRPRGQMTSKFTTKSGWLGVYMQELGQLRVVTVKDRVSVALVTNSCETILLGDLLRQINNRVAPSEREEVDLDRFADPSGKQRGRIVMARDQREMVTKRQVVYIDLGAEDNVKAGDYLTIYRPAGGGTVTRIENEEIARARSGGFESERFRGGKFSSMSQRTKDYSGAPGIFYKEQPVTTREIKRHRPPVPRKVVGEMVILNVQTRTATAIITRVAQEIHTGDFVELQ
ncbi:MAG TPA: hypothetical protein VGN95_00580 [Pyrinomonadaceae bacterium]|nr:hypothetical protein [Pyrinomonadaceae bacterium]